MRPQRNLVPIPSQAKQSCHDAYIGAIGNKLHRIPKVSKVCLCGVRLCPCTFGMILPISRLVDEGRYYRDARFTPYQRRCYHDHLRQSQARPCTETCSVLQAMRAHGLDTCSLELGRVFNHRFSRREICPPESHGDE
ncbi:hypothetical protein J3F83DRAFT_395954 [Trichoderma novae-zelandiae]